MVLDFDHLSLTHGVASLWSSRPNRVQRHGRSICVQSRQSVRAGRTLSNSTINFSLSPSSVLYSLRLSIRSNACIQVNFSSTGHRDYTDRGRCFLGSCKGRSTSPYIRSRSYISAHKEIRNFIEAWRLKIRGKRALYKSGYWVACGRGLKPKNDL